MRAADCSRLAANLRQHRAREDRLTDEDFVGALGHRPRRSLREERVDVVPEPSFLSNGARVWCF